MGDFMKRETEGPDIGFDRIRATLYTFRLESASETEDSAVGLTAM
jgi:hypothetical protein